MVGIVSKNVMTRQVIAVASEGDLVAIKLGNVEIKLGYEDALVLSQWIRVRAKEAKMRAGDTSRHWSVVGTLHDARFGPITHG